MDFLNRVLIQGDVPGVAALNISSTITNLFNVVFIAMGSALSIVVGQLLGAGKLEEAKEADIGVAGGDGCGVIFKNGEVLKKVNEDEIVEELLKEIEKI